MVSALGLAWGRPPLPEGMEGKAALFSPDGRFFAFERQQGWDRHLGLYDLETGNIDWIERGVGMAGLASWGSDGSLIYIAGALTTTAYRVQFELKNQTEEGYGIRIWKDGVKRNFTRGRRKDGTPALSPDGQFVYWVSPEGATDHRKAQMHLWRAPIADFTQRQLALTNCLDSYDVMVNQPQPSPDGKVMAWAMHDRLRDRWGIRLAKIDDLNRNVPITAPDLIAYEPRWSADGRYLVYTAWREGDPTWGCYLQEVRTGAERRICSGLEPCLSPDMKTLAYTDVDYRHLHFRSLTRADLPRGPEPADYQVPATVAPFFTTNCPSGTTQVAIPLDARFDFGDRQPFYVRLRMRFGEVPAKGAKNFLGAKYGRMGISYQMQIVDGKFVFVFRDAAYMSIGLETDIAATVGEHEFYLVRTTDRIFVSVDGSEPLQRLIRHGSLCLDQPIRAAVGGAPRDEVISWEFGKGWPAGLRRPLTRQEVFE